MTACRPCAIWLQVSDRPDDLLKRPPAPVKTLSWILGLFALSVGLVVAARYNSGYVLIVFSTHRIELSLNFAVALLALVFAALHVLARALTAALRLPVEVRRFHEDRRAEQGRASFMSGLQAYLEGRSGRAEKAAAAALVVDYEPALSAVIAARAAHETRSFEARDRYLAKLEEVGASTDYLRRITQAELLLDERRYLDALAVLEKIQDKHTASLRLELKAQQLARNWDRVEALLPLLGKRNVYDPAALSQLQRTATAELLKRRAIDLDRLREAWQKVPPELASDELVAKAAAESFLHLGAGEDARRILEAALEKQWDSQLVLLYAEGLGPNAVDRIQKAESWLPKHPRDASLLMTLGRLCAHASLWGKARSYFEASLAVEPSHTAHLELARLETAAGEHEAAQHHRDAALQLSLSQLDDATGGRRRRML